MRRFLQKIYFVRTLGVVGCLTGILSLQFVRAGDNESLEVPSFVALKLDSHEWPSWDDPSYLDSDPIGVYMVNGLEDVMLSDRILTSGIAAFDGEFYYIHYQYPFISWTTQISMYNPSTWQMEYEFYTIEQECENIEDYMPVSFAFDHVTGDLYGIFYGKEGRELSVIVVGSEYEPPLRYSSVPLNFDRNKYINSLCFDNDGNLFALTSGSEIEVLEDEIIRRYYGEVYLSKINRHTGEVSEIGDTGYLTGFGSYDANSLYCDHETGRLYAVFHHVNKENDKYVMTSELCEIDPQTGTATELLSYPDGRAYQGMYNPSPRWNPMAPDKCIDVQVDIFEESEMGTVTLVAPEHCAASVGDAAYQVIEGPLDIEVSVDGNLVGSAVAEAGNRVEIPIDLNSVQGGTYTFTAVACNSAGKGVPTRVHNIYYKGSGTGVDDSTGESKTMVETRGGMIRISGMDNGPVVISDLNGRVLFSGKVLHEMSIGADPGMYIVKTPGLSRKVSVPR